MLVCTHIMSHQATSLHSQRFTALAMQILPVISCVDTPLCNCRLRAKGMQVVKEPSLHKLMY
jgi:hypothetical protein